MLTGNGDIVAYKQLETYINNIFFGEMYILSVGLNEDDYTTIKWIQRSDKGDAYIKLVSKN